MELKVKDNKAKITLLYIHGYNSNGLSVQKLLEQKLNFNVVYFDYPTDKLYNAQELAKEIDKIIRKIKGSIVIMGHSLGGAVATGIQDRFKIKKYIYLSALTPIVAEKRGVKFLSKEIIGDSTLKNIMAKSLKLIGQESISDFINPPKQWSKFSFDNILNENYLNVDLRQNYFDKAEKSISIIGTKDFFFNFIKYNNFMSENNIKNYTIENAGHSTIIDAPIETAKIINSEIKFRRRWRRKIIKKGVY